MAKYRITDLEAKNLRTPGKWLSEPVGKRGEGELLLRSGEPVSAYYRYMHAGVRVKLPLGSISKQFPLQAAREKCREMSIVRRDHPDLKSWLELESLKKQTALRELQQQEHLESQKGSFGELLNDYVRNLESGNKNSAYNVQNTFQKNICEARPSLLMTRACDITPHDILSILQPIWDRGAHHQHNRTRSYLHAAFNLALNSEFNAAHRPSKVYGLKSNLVSPVTHQTSVEKARTRALSPSDLKTFYLNIDQAKGVGIIVATMLRFSIATGGQRPAQILRAKWSDYNFEQRILRIEERKGRGGHRVHLIPLTDRALELLRFIQPFSCEFDWPFTHTGDAPLALSTLKNAINRFLISDNGRGIEHFTARDIRRTVKQFMLSNKVPRDHANMLQSHGQGGLVGKHYDNDPETSLPIKRATIQAFDKALSTLLTD